MGIDFPPLKCFSRSSGSADLPSARPIRTLESEGLITVQRGSAGGAIVRRPDREAAAYMMALVLRGRETELDRCDHRYCGTGARLRHALCSASRGVAPGSGELTRVQTLDARTA